MMLAPAIQPDDSEQLRDRVMLVTGKHFMVNGGMTVKMHYVQTPTSPFRTKLNPPRRHA